MKKILRENKGFSMPMLVLFMMIALMITTVIMENNRCFVIAQNVDEALQAATNAVGAENMHNASHGVREGNSGAYSYNPSAKKWDTSIMTEQITENIKEALGLVSRNGKLYLPLKNDMGYSLSAITITYDNAQLAGGNSKTLTFTTSAHLEIPITFMSQAMPPLSLNRKVKTTFMNKF